MSHLPLGLRCCSSAVADWTGSCWAWHLVKLPKSHQQTWGRAGFSPKSKSLWALLPHKGPFEAVGTSWQGCLCLPTDGQALYVSKQSRVERWSLDPASISHDRASLGQEGSDVRALHSSWTKWRAVDRKAIIWSVRSLLNSPCFSFFFGGINALFACLSKSILARVQTLAWWQAVVWIRDAKICADSSFYTIWVRLSQLAITGLKRHTHVQQIAPTFCCWISEPAWWENVLAYTSLYFSVNKHRVSKPLFKCGSCLFYVDCLLLLRSTGLEGTSWVRRSTSWWSQASYFIIFLITLHFFSENNAL